MGMPSTDSAATRQHSTALAPSMQGVQLDNAAMAQLQTFQITPQDVSEWCEALGIHLPTNTAGQAQVSPSHLNLFKNIKKHLALGKSFKEIRQLVAIPPSNHIMPVKPASPYVSTPEALKLSTYRTHHENNGTLAELLERTLREKDDLQARLMETEKLNSHLYNANNLYHRKVRQLGSQLAETEHQESRYFKLLDDKSRLQAQLLESEKAVQQARQQLAKLQQESTQVQREMAAQVESLERQVKYLQTELSGKPLGEGGPHTSPAALFAGNGDVFVGTWQETATLLEVKYDQYGIELDSERNRTFRISSPPTLRAGAMAILNTQYAYETNQSWHRHETLMLAPSGPEQLEGLLEMTFWMNDAPMAAAVYKIHSQRLK